jgi:hypothetical protein
MQPEKELSKLSSTSIDFEGMKIPVEWEARMGSEGRVGKVKKR